MIRSSLPVLVAIPLVAGAAAAQSGQPGRDADLAITGVTVVDVERGRLIADQTVLVRDGRITAVAPSGHAQSIGSSRVIDGQGRYLIPGLLDMHVHLTNSGKPTDIEMPLFVAHGVTGVQVMSSDRPSADPTATPGLAIHRNWQALIEAGTLVGPRLLALATWAVNGPVGIAPDVPAFFKASTRARDADSRTTHTARACA